MKSVSLVGIDYSMICPAIVVFDTKKGEFKFSNCSIYYQIEKNKKLVVNYKNVSSSFTPKFDNSEDRWAYLAENSIKVFPEKALVALEDYAFSRRGQVFSIGENTGVLKDRMKSRGNLVRKIEPSTLKKFATGYKDSSKKEMYDQFLKDDPEGGKILNKLFDIKIEPEERTTKTRKGEIKAKKFVFVQKNGRHRDTRGMDSPISDIVDAYYLCKYLYGDWK